MNYLYSDSDSDSDSHNEFERIAKEYFIQNSILKRNNSFFLLYDEKDDDKKLFKLEKTEWKPASPLEKLSLLNESLFQRDSQDFNDIVGYMGYVKNELFFKTKNITDTRSRGIVCHPKPKSIELLNHVIGEKIYTSENTKKQKDIELCILLEMMLRYYEYYEKNGKKWFVSPELSIVYDFHKVVDKKYSKKEYKKND